MSALSLHTWLLLALGSVASAALALGLGRMVQRLWPQTTATPGLWFGAWCLAVLAPLLSVLLAGFAPVPLAALPVALPLPLALDNPASTLNAVVSPGRGWPSLGAVLMAAWLLGSALALFRLLAGSWAAYQVVRDASEVRDASNWPGPASTQQALALRAQGIKVRLTSQAMTPFAVRWPRPTIVLPESALHHFSDLQLRLVLRHEAAHLERSDPQRAGTMAMVGALLWFNPFVRRIAARVQLAAELRCDAMALGGDAAAGRSFAVAYLGALRLAGHGSAPSPVTALTHRDMAGHQLRIQHMLRGGSAIRTSWPGRAAVLAALLVSGTVMTVVQAAVLSPAPLPPLTTLSSMSATMAPASIPRLPAVEQRFSAPLAQVRINSHFGDNGGIRQRAHRGTDFAARVGTLVMAPADGVVLAATPHYPEGDQYGTVVVIDHGNGWQSLFAHLDSTSLQPGQRVRGGDPIARSGRSGRVTGPHLHWELLLNGERVDPLKHLQ